MLILNKLYCLVYFKLQDGFYVVNNLVIIFGVGEISFKHQNATATYAKTKRASFSLTTLPLVLIPLRTLVSLINRPLVRC